MLVVGDSLGIIVGSLDVGELEDSLVNTDTLGIIVDDATVGINVVGNVMPAFNDTDPPDSKKVFVIGHLLPCHFSPNAHNNSRVDRYFS